MAVGPPVFVKLYGRWHRWDPDEDFTACDQPVTFPPQRANVVPAGGELCPRCRPSGRSFVV